MAREAHITDEELTLWIDGELERTRIEPVQEHLAQHPAILSAVHRSGST